MGVFLLSDLSLDDLVTTAQACPADDTDAMAEVLRRFERAVASVARSATGDWDLQPDAAQAARLGLVRAVRAHTPGTAGFTTYAWQYMKGAARRLVSSMPLGDLTLDPQNALWLEIPATVEALGGATEVIDITRGLKPEQQAIAVAYYVDGLRLSDIAARLGISKPAVSQRLSTISRILRPIVEEALAA